MQEILEQFKGIKTIASIKTRKKKLNAQMRNEAGEIEALRMGVAHTFAKLYADLYSDRNNGRPENERDSAENETME